MMLQRYSESFLQLLRIFVFAGDIQDAEAGMRSGQRIVVLLGALNSQPAGEQM